MNINVYKLFKKCLFTNVLLLIFVINTNAQILNIESFRLEKDSAKVFLGNLGFGFSTKKQLVSVTRFNTNVNAAYLSDLHSYMVLSTLSLVKVSNLNVLSEGYVHFRINFLRKNKFSPEQFTQIQYDKGRGMDSRFLTGLCLRYRIFSNSKIVVAANSGLMYESEVWFNSVENKSSSLIKSTSNLTLKAKITPTLSFFMITYYQAIPNQYFIRPRLITDATLQFKISNKFVFNTQYVATYDDMPIISIPNFIYSLNSAIQYNF